MKRIALMQPYLFPYIGYFQLIKAVDQYIVYDDVQWMKGGWINRNRILEFNEPSYITLPVKKDSMKKNINERYFVDNIESEKLEMLNRIKEAYSDAPCFSVCIELLEKILSYDENNVALFISNSIKEICKYLDITTEIVMSSSMDKTPGLKSQDKVIDICKRNDAEQYINAIGGQALYDKEVFLEHEIKLLFIKSNSVEYKQFDTKHTPHLSIIDTLMFNQKEVVKKMLNMYELI